MRLQQRILVTSSPNCAESLQHAEDHQTSIRIELTVQKKLFKWFGIQARRDIAIQGTEYLENHSTETDMLLSFEKPMKKFTNFMNLFGNSAIVFLMIQGQKGPPISQSKHAGMAIGYYSFRSIICAKNSSSGFVKRTRAILIYG